MIFLKEIIGQFRRKEIIGHKAKEAENKHEKNNLTANNTMNKLQHVGTLKYNNFFNIHADTHIQRVGSIISG